MTKRKYYAGSVGPLLYDDEDPIDDHDGDFAGEDRVALRTDGSLRASGDDDHDDALVKNSTIQERIYFFHNALGDRVDNVESDLTTLENYTHEHGDEHLSAGADPLPTKVVTVVTSVNFAAETVTTEDVVVVDDEYVS